MSTKKTNYFNFLLGHSASTEDSPSPNSRCICYSFSCPTSSGGSPPGLGEGAGGRTIRVRVNKSLRMNAIRQELEREQAKLERRRHKSGELRELRKKQKEQEEMANLVDREKQIQIEDAQNETSHSIPNGVEEAVSDNIPLGEPSLNSTKEQEPEQAKPTAHYVKIRKIVSLASCVLVQV